jgi:molecular chaperone GrpE
MKEKDPKSNEQDPMSQVNEQEARLSDEEQRLNSCMQQLQEWKNKYAYMNADFENYKRRMAQERAVWRQTGQIDFIRKLLPVIDGIDRAFSVTVPTTVSAEQQAWFEGFKMVANGLQAFLREVGVQEIPTSGAFNPELHEAVSQVETSSHHSGDIVEVLQRGFTLNGVVIRPATVSVAK